MGEMIETSAAHGRIAHGVMTYQSATVFSTTSRMHGFFDDGSHGGRPHKM